MTDKMLVRNIIDHKEKHKIGYQFNDDKQNNHIFKVLGSKLLKQEDVDPKLFSWGRHEVLLKQLHHDFNGDVCFDNLGNIYGRLNGLTKGECVKGALYQWDNLETYELPKYDPNCYADIAQFCQLNCDKYNLVDANFSIFSNFRDARLMTNALMDTVLEPDNIKLFLRKINDRLLEFIENIKDSGVDGMIMYDDWGTQDRTFIAPATFREIFKPFYKELADKLHSYNMHFFLHTCGYNLAFFDDFIDAGIDVLQLDQLGLYGYEMVAEKYSDKITFYSPVDVQRILPTGDREIIEGDTKRMLKAFGGKGALLVKDYPSYGDIAVKNEWATWAKDIFRKHNK
ncbi:MAG: uroporphyrinogen decarboxylase family protein [Clostridia bacterium]